MALAADGPLAALLPKLGAHFVAAEVKQFRSSELDNAIEWVAKERG